MNALAGFRVSASAARALVGRSGVFISGNYFSTTKVVRGVTRAYTSEVNFCGGCVLRGSIRVKFVNTVHGCIMDSLTPINSVVMAAMSVGRRIFNVALTRTAIAYNGGIVTATRVGLSIHGVR